MVKNDSLTSKSMKTSLITLPIIFSIVACDPPRDLYQTGIIVINAQVVNPTTTITLGDSVAFYFDVPDSVELNGVKVKVSAENSDGASIGLTPYKIIPSHIGGSTNNPSFRTCNLYANPGSLSTTETLIFHNQAGKLIGKLFMIPQQIGIYYLLQTENGYIDLNNGRLKLRFTLNFGNIIRNHQMLIDSAGAANNFDQYLQDRTNRGYEVYGFKVK